MTRARSKAYSGAFATMIALLDSLDRLVSLDDIDHAAAYVERAGICGPLECRAAKIRVRGLYGYGRLPNGCYEDP